MDNNQHMYRKAFSYFEDWCRSRDIAPLEARATNVQAYISEMPWSRKQGPILDFRGGVDG